MLNKTDTRKAPWHIVRSDDKRTARFNTIAHLLETIQLPGRSTNGAYDDDKAIAGRRCVKERC